MHILAIHPSSELYGSDRSFLDAIRGISGSSHKVTVVLAKDGPLVPHLRDQGVTIIFGELAQIQRGIFTPVGVMRWIRALQRGLKSFQRMNAQNPFDVVYTDTISLPLGAWVARKLRIPHVWHIREIIHRPRMVSWVLRKCVHNFSDLVICNSKATMEWIGESRGGVPRIEVVWNGIDPWKQQNLGVSLEEQRAARGKLGFTDEFVLLLPGRINAWKGQDLLLDAVERLSPAIRKNFRVLFLGDVAEMGGAWKSALEARIANSQDPTCYRLEGFHPDLSVFYAAADLVVVPSKEPEPFGRVVIEGMCRGRPVVAAGHGGLVEIVRDGVTGRLFKPRDPDSLSDVLEEMFNNASSLTEMGRQARTRVLEVFSLSVYQEKVLAALESVTTRV